MRKVGTIFIVIASLFIINSLVRSIYNLWQKQELVVQTAQELAEEKKRNAALKEQYSRVQKEGYVEEEARNKLFYVKPGEQVVIVGEREGTTSAAVTAKETDRKPNWRRWLELFL